MGPFILLFLLPGAIALNPNGSPTCDWMEGFLFLALGPILSIHVFSGIGLLAFRCVPSRPHTAAGGFTLFLIVWEAIHFLVEPAVFGFSPLYGYFAGPVYDANISVEVPYIMTRAVLLCALWSAFIARFSPRKGLLQKAFLGWSALLCGIVVFSPPAWGLSGKQRVVEHHLDTVVQTGPLTIRARVRTPAEEKHLNLFVSDALQRFQELESYFGFRPASQLNIYLYPSAELQRKWMGAGRVRVAKPWRSEIHIPRLPIRDPVVKHEMAHVFAGELSDSLLRVPSQWGIFPNMALIEGLATRLEQRRGERSLHQWAAGLESLEKLPDVERMFNPSGYLNVHGAAGYAASGSFFAYLEEQFGKKRLFDFYRSGDFQATYSLALGEGIEGWKQMLRENIDLSDAIIDETRYRLDRKPVLQRDCPVVIQGLRREAAQRSRADDWREALALRREICALIPESDEAALQLALTTLHSGDAEEAELLFSELHDSRELTRSLADRVKHGMADALWLQGRPTQAEKLYENLMITPVPSSTLRALQIKLDAIRSGHPSVSQALKDYLIRGQGSVKEKRSSLLQSQIDHPKNAPLAYLASRIFVSEQNYPKALELLEKLRTYAPSPLVASEIFRLRGIAYLKTGKPSAAKQEFAEAHLLCPEDREGQRLALMDWKNLALFMEKSSLEGPP